MITDPWFYAVAIPAVILVGISKSGFGAAFGALAVPMLALTIPVPQAAAIMLPLLLVMDCLGLMALLKHCDRGLLRILLPAGLVGTLFGTWLFGVLPAVKVAAVVGAVTLVFLAIRVFHPPRPEDPLPPRWLGLILGATSGFTSFVAHAGGPPIGFYLIPMRLSPQVFAATISVFFATMNFAKVIPYTFLGLVDTRNLLTSAVLLPLAPLGVWIGLRIGQRISPAAFNRAFHLGMLLTGVKLLWDGL